MKRKFWICCFLCLNVLIQVFSQENENVVRSGYFAVLTFWESPYIPFKGACPITKEVAANRIHLQLDYDQENRVITAHVKLGEHYKDFLEI